MNRYKTEFPREAFTTDEHTALGILSPSKVFFILNGDYGQAVLDQYTAAVAERRNNVTMDSKAFRNMGECIRRGLEKGISDTKQ